MAVYPFLSDEWLVEVRRVFEDRPINVPSGTELRMNLLVTDTPFGADRQVHVLVAEGTADFGLGHIETVDLTITTDYDTARELFVAGELPVAMAALLEGRVKIQGDLTKLMAAQAAGVGPGSSALADALTEITA